MGMEPKALYIHARQASTTKLYPQPLSLLILKCILNVNTPGTEVLYETLGLFFLDHFCNSLSSLLGRDLWRNRILTSVTLVDYPLYSETLESATRSKNSK
jgi:hypothetical protein